MDETQTVQYNLITQPSKLPSTCIMLLLDPLSLTNAFLWIITLLIAASSTVLIIFALPWYSSPFPQHYFNENCYVALEDTFQPFILCIIGPLTMTVMYAPEFTFTILYQVGVPSCIFFVGFFTIIYWVLDISLVWYNVDGPIMCVQYIIICTASIYQLASMHKHTYHRHSITTQVTYSKWQLFKWVVVPITWLFLTIGVFGGPGLEYYLSLNAKYQYIFRLIVWPPLIQFTLGFAERLILKVSTQNNATNNSGKLHPVLLAQVIFSIYGRVMIFSGKNLLDAILLAIGHCLQEILFHRWSRQICRINFEIRTRFLNRICCNPCRSNRVLTFEEYFSSQQYKDYRSYIINIEYLIEIIGIISTSLIFITFYKWKYVFNFDYPLNDSGSGVDVEFVVIIGLLQLVFEIISYFIIICVELKFNDIKLLVSWRKLNHLQMISAIFIVIEAVVSAATVTRSVPNIIACTNKNDVCSCAFATDWSGC